jgi:hypothetical protein
MTAVDVQISQLDLARTVADWATHQVAPLSLEHAGANDQAARLRELPSATDADNLDQMVDTVRDALHELYPAVARHMTGLAKQANQVSDRAFWNHLNETGYQDTLADYQRRLADLETPAKDDRLNLDIDDDKRDVIEAFGREVETDLLVAHDASVNAARDLLTDQSLAWPSSLDVGGGDDLAVLSDSQAHPVVSIGSQHEYPDPSQIKELGEIRERPFAVEVEPNPRAQVQHLTSRLVSHLSRDLQQRLTELRSPQYQRAYDAEVGGGDFDSQAALVAFSSLNHLDAALARVAEECIYFANDRNELAAEAALEDIAAMARDSLQTGVGVGTPEEAAIASLAVPVETDDADALIWEAAARVAERTGIEAWRAPDLTGDVQRDEPVTLSAADLADLDALDEIDEPSTNATIYQFPARTDEDLDDELENEFDGPDMPGDPVTVDGGQRPDLHLVGPIATAALDPDEFDDELSHDDLGTADEARPYRHLVSDFTYTNPAGEVETVSAEEAARLADDMDREAASLQAQELVQQASLAYEQPAFEV